MVRWGTIHWERNANRVNPFIWDRTIRINSAYASLPDLMLHNEYVTTFRWHYIIRNTSEDSISSFRKLQWYWFSMLPWSVGALRDQVRTKRADVYKEIFFSYIHNYSALIFSFLRGGIMSLYTNKEDNHIHVIS